MKAGKYIAFGLAIVVVLAMVSWVLRNAIIERLSGPFLREYGVEITDVSLDALAIRNASISYLELELRDGTSISIDDLTLPFGSPQEGSRTFAAERVSIVAAAESDDRHLNLAALAERILTLPGVLPSTVIEIDQLRAAPYPDLQDVEWSTTEGAQKLTASLGVVHLSAHIRGSDGNIVQVSLATRLTSIDRPEQELTATIRRTESGFVLTGTSAVDLPAIGMTAAALAESFDSTLAGIEFADGAAVLEVSGTLSVDGSAVVDAELISAVPFELAYSAESGVVNVVSVRSAEAVRLGFNYPEGQWSLNEEELSLLMSYGEWNDLSVSLKDLDCRNGPICSMDADASIAKVRPAFVDAERFDVSAAGGTLARTASGWQLAARSVDADIGSLRLGEDRSYSGSIAIHDLLFEQGNQSVTATSALNSATGSMSWHGVTISLPEVEGRISYRENTLAVDLMTVDLHENGRIEARHDLASESGHVSFVDTTLSFGSRNLAERVSPLPIEIDVSAGTLSWDLQFGWQLADEAFSGKASLAFDDVAGLYADTAFAGLTTNISVAYDSTAGFTVAPSTIDVGLVEIGLPLEDISANYTLNLNDPAADIDNLQMHAFGGVIRAEPFTFRLADEKNTLLLRAESIELARLLTLEEFEAVELTGRIGAELPVIIEGTEVTILDGKLTGEAPGGVIRYHAEMFPGNDPTSGVGIATKALSNFEYETLTSDVGYSRDGDLVLRMQLTGRNPDVENGRLVVLNLSVENNIPDMLRSLQGSRAVEAVLERRLRRK
jgi:hypothetical protein